MTFLGVGFIGSGLIMLWAAYEGRSALETVRAVLRNEPIPRGSRDGLDPDAFTDDRDAPLGPVPPADPTGIEPVRPVV